MKHAPRSPVSRNLAAVAPNGLIAGLDWAKDDHVICVVDTTGAVRDRFSVEHSAAGLVELVRRLARLGCAEIAIERPDGPVIDTLLAAQLTVGVISPNQVKNLRGRYGSAGNKDDRFDAYVLADTLRTDRARLRALVPDSPATVSLRAVCRARKDLVGTRVAIANQLRAHLHKAFPAGAALFTDVDSPISLTFLTRFPHQGAADWLTPKRLAHWLAAAGYCGRKTPDELHARLRGAPCGATGDHGLALSHVTTAYLATLQTLRAQISALEHQIAEQLAAHPDNQVFTACSPRSARTAHGSPLPTRSPASPASPPAPARPASPITSDSAGPATNNSATLSPTSPETADELTHGRRTSTPKPGTAGTTTPTQFGSSPAPGCSSSGTAGKTTPPTTQRNTTPCNASSPNATRSSCSQVDTGLLSRPPA